MTRTIRRFAVPALAAIAAALPFTVGPGGMLERQTACAQTGACKRSIGSVCFLNGDVMWDAECVCGGG